MPDPLFEVLVLLQQLIPGEAVELKLVLLEPVIDLNQLLLLLSVDLGLSRQLCFEIVVVSLAPQPREQFLFSQLRVLKFNLHQLPPHLFNLLHEA